jgi:hypothetical protein
MDPGDYAQGRRGRDQADTLVVMDDRLPYAGTG